MNIPLPSILRSNWRTGLCLMLLLLGSGGARAQSVASYVPARTTGNTYTSLGATGLSYTWRSALSTDDNLSTATPIGFPFAYDGTVYSQFSVSTNGYLTLNTGTAAVGSSTTAYGYQNTQFSTAAGTVTTLAPFYDDQQTAGNLGTLADLNTSLKYLTTGTVGNRVLTAEWINMQDFATASTSSFNYQVKLYEADGHIEFNYGVMTYSGTTTTMSYSLGINSPAGGATAANLLTLQTANTNTFSSTASDALGGTTAANMPTANSRYSFTPPAASVAAPTSLTFSSVGYTSTRVNFVDNSTNEYGFALFRSTDNITFTLVGTGLSPSTAATGAGYFFTSAGLTAGTTYYYQVVANSEGTISAPLTGSQATLVYPASMAGTFTINNTATTNATSTGGNFNNFTDAIAALNQATIAGAITLNVSNSQTFNETPPVITATGTSTNTITFQEATLTPTVLTDNPKITPTGTAGLNDGGLVVSGGDYFTFDGINVDASAGTAIEYGYLVRNASTTNGALNNTFRNAAITLNRANTASAGVLQNSASTLGGAVVATATGVNQNNKFLSLQIRNAYSGITLFGVSTTIVDINTEVASCAIGDPAVLGDIGNGNGTGTTAAYGIRSVLQSQQSIHDNVVSNVYAAAAATGISIEQSVGSGTTAGKVYNNKVGAVRNNSTSSTSVALGIRGDVVNITGQLLSVYNNFITNITSAYTGTSTATRIIRGMYLQSGGTGSGSTINAYFNSVRLDGTASPNATSTCFEIGTSSGPVFDVRNNVFANLTTGQTSTTQGKHYTWISTSGTLIGATGSVSNYNDLYVVGTPGDGTRGYIGAQGTPSIANASTTIDRITLADWQVTPAKDGNSVSVDPQFTAATDLHLQGISTLNNIGTPIAAVTFDIDNETANRATTPDIGGDEFTPPSADVALTSINGPAAPFATGSYPVTITIRNAGIDPLNTVGVSYIFNGTPVSLGTVTLASPLTSGNSTTVSLATLTFGAGNNTLSVTLSNPNSVTDPTPANNTLAQSFRPALCGNYNVGAGGDFTTLDAAAAALNAAGATCAITFTLTDATYAATTGIVINQFPGVSSTNTLTIKPGAGVSALITGGIAAGATLKLNGADYVTIDGSNNGTTSQNLTIENTSATGSGNAVLWLAAASATDGATFNTVKNTVIRGNSASGFPQFTVFLGGGGVGVTSPTTSTPVANSNNTFTNNTISKGSHGVFVFGTSATALDQSNTFTGNQLGQGTGNGFGLEGLRAVYQQGLTLTGNEIQNLTNSTTGSNLYGIFLADCKGAVISRNSVHNISYTGTSTSKVWAIHSTTTTFITVGNASANRFDTNLVYNINSTATSTTWNTVGINCGGGYGDQYYFNTVYLTGQLSAASGTSGSAAFANGNPSVTAVATNIEVRSNIFSIVGGTGGTTATPLYAHYTQGTTYAGSTLDNNDLFVSAGATGLAVTGRLNAADAATLAAWQTATTQEANSRQVNPTFAQTATVPFDLTPSNVALNNAGVAIAGITLDYPGTTRGTVPDIGAYEFTPPATLDLKPVSLLAPLATQVCFTNAEPVTVQLLNNGGADIDFSTTTGTVTVVVTPPSGVANNQTFATTLATGTLASGATQNVTLPGTLDMTAVGAYSFAIAASVPGDILTTDNITATRTNAAPQAALPYAEPFTSSTLPANFTTTSLSLSTSANNGGATGSYGLRVNIYSGIPSATATTPILGTTVSSSSVLTFDARFTNFTGGAGTVLSANDRIEVQVATCGGAFTTVYTINGTNQSGTGTASASFFTYSVPLTGVGVGQKIQVRLAAAYGGSSGNDFYVDLDNINVQSLVNTDLAATALAAPTTTQGCYGPAETVTVTVKNQGTAALDFALNPATVTVGVTGVAPATLTTTLTSGTLAAGATQNVVMTSTLNMSTFGAYTFAIGATVTGDQNLTNDNLTPVPTITTVAPVAGTLTPAAASICQSGTATLALTGAANGIIQYQSSPDNVTFTDITGATSAAYTTPVLTNTTYYRAQTRCGLNNATSNVATITVNNPLITGTNTPVVVCAGSTATLTATGSTGTTVRFFAVATGGTALATGTTGAATASYTTPALSAGATYYAEALIANGGTTSMSPLTNALGTGTASTVSHYLTFNVAQPTILIGVYVYPGAAGNVVIEYRSATGTVLQSATVAVTAAQVNTKTFVPLNFSLVAGTAQRLGIGTGSVSLFRNDAGASYPYTAGAVSITGNSFDPAYYYYYYNWQVSSDCASTTRTPVPVTVTPAATANAGTAPAGICVGSTYSTTGSYGGSATSATYTSSGTGTFSNGGLIDGTTPSVTYSPSAADITAGTVTLTLTTAGPCAAAVATLPLTISTTTTYTGAAPGDGSNWFNTANWTACVPSATVNALVPAGLANYPTLTTTATAEVRSLTIASGASIAQTAGALAVYGDLNNAGTADLTGGTVALRGTAPTVTGLSSLASLEVNLGSSGTATLGNALNIGTRLTMTQGLLSTSSYTLTLLFPATLSETEASYLVGTVSVPDRTLTAGTAESFGGIGLVLTPAPASVSPGATPVVRTTGTALAGAGTSQSIQRYFDIQPATNTGLNVAMDFSYFNHELNGIAAGNLALFKSVTTTAGPWANQSPTTAAGNTIAKTGIADFSIWTLGNGASPLPVELVAFAATRSGNNAALAWATASEKSSRGFEVQVSTDGRSFRMLGFVASPTASSTASREYAYLDQEAGKAGLRYYRLRQLDLNGTASFSPVRTVRFEGEVAALGLSAAPNPFRERLALTITLPASLAGQALELRLTDAAGRVLSTQRLAGLAAGSSEVLVPEAAHLSTGLYFVQLVAPGQPTQHLKVMKE